MADEKPMDEGTALMYIREQKAKLRHLDEAEAALMAAAAAKGAIVDLEAAKAKVADELGEAQADCRARRAELADLGKALKDRQAKLVFLQNDTAKAEEKLADTQARISAAIADSAHQIREGLDAAVGEMKAKARDEIASIREEIADLIKTRDGLQSQVDQILGNLKAVKEPSVG